MPQPKIKPLSEFPPFLLEANKRWNDFTKENAEWVFSYMEKRQRVLDDWTARDERQITDETKNLRLQELYEENYPLSREFAEIFRAVKNAERAHAPFANREVLASGDAPHWAKIIDDTLPGGVGHEETKRKVFYPGSQDGITRIPDGLPA